MYRNIEIYIVHTFYTLLWLVSCSPTRANPGPASEVLCPAAVFQAANVRRPKISATRFNVVGAVDAMGRCPVEMFKNRLVDMLMDGIVGIFFGGDIWEIKDFEYCK